MPQLVTAAHDLLAVPLTKIFNHALLCYDWPQQWKKETVTVIPKGQTPQDFSDYRNLSCTALFSKVLEAIVLEKINTEVNVDRVQFGGTKRCGIEHLLIEAWDRILNHLDDNRASANLSSIDYAKAFNCMQHQACLKAFQRKGASQHTINIIACFLSGCRRDCRMAKSNQMPGPSIVRWSKIRKEEPLY